MSRKFLVALLAGALTASMSAQAQLSENGIGHRVHQQPAAGNDARQLVNFPPEMRRHTLANMRDHLEALSEILGAMGERQYARASRIASARLGLDSPSAEGCRPQASADAPQRPAQMDHQMGQFMPESMRSLGLSMHQAASEFAAEAATAGKSGNAAPALSALSKVTGQCSACHAGFRVQ